MYQNEHHVYGPPGTGKTTQLSKWITQTAERHGVESMIIMSFTRAAATELVQRGLPVPRERIGTLHAHCYRALGRPTIIDADKGLMQEWNQSCQGQHRLSDTERPQVIDHGFDAIQMDTPGDKAKAQSEMLRQKMVPREVWPSTAVDFMREWDAFKQNTNSIDFTDMIELGIREFEHPPNGASIGFVDETQDLTRLELTLVRQWADHMDQVVMAGDDDQCQPPGTMVQTNTGERPIEELDSMLDRVISYNRPEGALIKAGRSFRLASRPYRGTMYRVSAGGNDTRCTPNHKWLVRWNEKARTTGHVVYLMRKGDRWRVGWCKLINNTASSKLFHLGQRARLEEADAAWILYATDDRTDASIMESYVSAKYGIPTITFHEVDGATHYTALSIDRLFAMLGDLSSNVDDVLQDFGLDIRYPIWQPNHHTRGGSKTYCIEAMNLLSGYMDVPVADIESRSVSWLPLERDQEEYDGPVYSLDVSVDETYVADGLVTHNSLYWFRGATPDAFLEANLPQDRKHILRQSYRVPSKVHALSQQWIAQVVRREPKAYQPREDPGTFRYAANLTWKDADALAQALQRDASDGKKVMLLASCGYMLDRVIAVLRRDGVPFHNPWRRINHRWNPLFASHGVSMRERLLAYIHPDARVFGEMAPESWTAEDLNRWASVMEAKGILRHGAKDAITKLSGKHVLADDKLNQYLDDDALVQAKKLDPNWWAMHLLTKARTTAQYPMTVLHRRGVDALLDEPKITIGTIHSVKGGEADRVYLLPDLSMSGFQSWSVSRSEAHDAIVRMFYVGMTRARESLTICGASSAYAVNLPKVVPELETWTI